MEVVDANAIYYTLSTIAQTLAAALGILVAAVLFKLASLARERDQAGKTLDAYGIDADYYLPIAERSGHDAMLDAIHEKTEPSRSTNEAIRRACAAAATIFQDWGRINLRLYIALGATVVDIAICLVALPNTKDLLDSGLAPRVVYGTVTLSFVCLLLYVWLIAAMVRRPPRVGQ